MAKTFDNKATEKQFNQKLRTMISCVIHTQNVADQAMDIAGRLLNDEEKSDSDAYRVIENVSCVCEEAIQVLCEELQKSSRLYEILPVEADDIRQKAIEEF